MKPSHAASLRAFFHLIIGIAFVILMTGGGRLGKVDFISLDAWIAVALIPAFLLIRSGQDPFYPAVRRVRDRIASQPRFFVGVVFTALALAHLVRFLTLHVHVFDAGYLYQSIFQAFRGPFLKCDVCFNGTYLGAHSAFTLAFLSPLATVAASPFVLPFIQAALGLACFALIGAAFRMDLDRRRLAWIFFVLLAIRGIRESFIFDLREDLLGAFFFTIAFFALKRGRPYLALVPFALAALSKETAAILLPFAAFAGLYAQGKPSRTLIVIYFGFSLALFGVIYFGVLPQWTPNAGSGSDLAKRLAYLGNSPTDILLNLVRHPLNSAFGIFEHLMTLERARYLLVIAGPLTYIAIRGFNYYYLPGYVLLIGNLLSESPAQRMMQFHYEVLLIPFFGFGLAESARRLQNKSLPAYFFSGTLLLALTFSGTWPMSHLRMYLREGERIADVRWGRDQIAGRPPAEAILGDALTYPLISERENLRFLGDAPYAPEAKSAMGELPLGDSRFALLLRENGDLRLGTDWEKVECGPLQILCTYRRK